MTLINKRILLFGILLIMQLFSCKKPIFKQFDKRYKYIGKYSVHKTIKSYGFPEFGEPYSYETDTTISINFGETDSTLNVLGRDVWLDSTGRYGSYHYGLRLWDDSISSIFMNGGLGSGQYISYLGIKISNKP